jgi:hypothetical protein
MTEDITLSRHEGYLGNQNIKRSGVGVNWTPEMVDEYVKCMNDPIYFAEKYIKIVSLDRGFVPIKLYDYQKEIIEKAIDPTVRNVAALTARQAGKCVEVNTIMKIRNKKTGQVEHVTAGELHARFSKKYGSNSAQVIETKEKTNQNRVQE